MSSHTNHPYHLVEKRPWPITSSVRALLLTSGLIKWFNIFSYDILLIALIRITISATLWWRDVSREASFQGLHTHKVTTGIRFGILLFIVSEVLFFFSFFWAFFNRRLAPTIELGSIWPPININPFNPFITPLLNTAILLASGVTVTWCHHAIIEQYHSQSFQALTLTIILGIYFSALQAIEYNEASFSISDSVYGASFFLITGFHGLHVLIGTTFLIVSFIRLYIAYLRSNHHIGLEAAIWYWHFVDVVWLFLYVSIYWWGS